MSIGSLEIKLLADVAQLRADMGQATGIVSGASSKMTEGFGMVSKALAAVGVGLSVAGFTNWIRGAIDAADQMSKFSTKTGLAAKDVAGLQLAFKLGGVESEAMGASIMRMTREMAKGNDAFDTLGVKTRDVTTGALRPVKDVLYDTADALASVKGDTERSALAMEIFGKSGADLLPVFANGADGLKEMADMADKLGLVMDGDAASAAESFNDTLELIGMSTQGVGRQVAAQLLPALNGIVGAFLEFVTEGDRVKRMAEIIASGLKVMYAAGVAIVEVFSTVGKTVGASMAAIVKIMQGDFKGAINVGEEWATDMKRDWTAAIKNVGDAWEGTSSDSTKAMGAMTRSMRTVTVATDEQKKATKEQEAATKKAADEYAKYTRKLDDAIASQQRQADGLGPLTEAQKLERDLLDAIENGTVKVTDKQKEELLGRIKLLASMTESNAQRKEEEARLKAVYDELSKAAEAQWEKVRALEKSNAELATQNAKLGLTEKELAAYTAETLRAEAAQLDLTAAQEGGNVALSEQARLLRERADLVEQGVAIKEAQAVQAEWAKTVDQIGQGLTDSLYRAFESGADFFKTFWDGLKNTFKTTVLQLLIDPVMRPINAAIGTALGGMSGGATAATGGAGGVGSILSGLGSIGSMMSGLGGLFSAGAGMTMSGGFGAAMGAAGAALGNGSIGAGLSIGAGALAPFAAGVAAIYGIYHALRRERTPHSGGGALSTATGGAAASWQQVTGLGPRNLDISSEAEQGMIALSQSIAQTLQPLADLAGAGVVKVGTAYADDKSRDPAWGALRILAGNRSLADWGGTQMFADGEAGYKAFVQSIADSTRGAIDKLALPEWARKITRELKDGATLDDITKAVQQIREMGEAQKAFVHLSRFGGIFSQMAGSSIEAQKALVDLMGGIDGLTAAAGQFVSQYYSEGEQAAISARQVVDALKQAGVNVGNLRTKDDYRNLLETINPTTENTKQIAALLQNAGAAAQLFDYLGANKDSIAERTLVQLAQGAPLPETLQSIMQMQANQGQDVVTAIADSGTTVSDAIDAMKTEVKTLLEGIAASSAATARQLQTWDDGGTLSTTAVV